MEEFKFNQSMCVWHTYVIVPFIMLPELLSTPLGQENFESYSLP
jgi:hypothetical protein